MSLLYRPPDKDSDAIRLYTQNLDDIRIKMQQKMFVISDRQFGFRAGHSTGNASTYIVQQLQNAIEEKHEAGLICLDISRAFD